MTGAPKIIGSAGFIAQDVIWRGDATVGHCSTVGYPVAGTAGPRTEIGDGVIIGAFCIVEQGAVLASHVSVDHYCRIGTASTIGERSKILYGAQIFENCVVGARCIIGGDVDDRVLIEDDVTFMGSMAHSYRDPGTIDTWDQLEQPSPVIRRGAVVGQCALLVGAVVIGEGAYVAAGEIVRHDVPSAHVFYRGQLSPISKWRGVIKARKQSE